MGFEQRFPGLQSYAQALAKEAFDRGNSEKLVNLSKRLHVIADKEIGEAQALVPPLKCQAGCCHCCHGLIKATLPELEEIAAAVRNWDAPARDGLEERFAAYNEASAAYWRFDAEALSAPCPFLIEGLCSIYAERPLSCRGLNSYDVAACEDRRFGRPAQVLSCVWQTQIGDVLISGIGMGAHKTSNGSGIYELGTGIQSVLGGEPHRLEKGQLGGGPVPRIANAVRSLVPSQLAVLKTFNDKRAKYFAAERMVRTTPLAALYRVVMPPSYESEADFQEWGQRYEAAVNQLLELDLDPRAAFDAIGEGAMETFSLYYRGEDVKPIVARLIGHAYQNYARPAFPAWVDPIEGPRKPGRFRLGYISSRLTSSSGSRWALGWLTEQAPEFETFAFNLHDREDAVSARWKRNSDHYFHLPLPAAKVAEFVRGCDLDALIFVDITTMPVTVQLSMLRLARHQLCGWGHPMTTGSPVIDTYIASGEMEPVNGQEHYTERLLKLSGSGLTYPRATTPPSTKSAAELGLSEDGYLLIAQNPVKLLPRRDAVFREIAERTGKPMVICTAPDPEAGKIVASRMRRAGMKSSLVTVERMPTGDFMRMTQLADCVLDSFDFSGGITTVDTLTLGRPLVSCPGTFLRSRMSIPFLRQAGVEAMLTENERAYIELACDPARIAENMSAHNPEPMFRDLKPLRDLEAFLLGQV